MSIQLCASDFRLLLRRQRVQLILSELELARTFAKVAKAKRLVADRAGAECARSMANSAYNEAFRRLGVMRELIPVQEVDHITGMAVEIREEIRQTNWRYKTGKQFHAVNIHVSATCEGV